MFTPVTRRRFIQITPVIGIAGMTAFAACSPKEEPSSAKPAPAPSPAPAPTAAPAPAAAPAAPAVATSLPMLDEKEPQAMALGYVDDASRADKVKFNNYAPGNQCRNCANFLGSADDSAAGCKIFPGKRVTAQGWCSAWLKKA